MLRWMMSPGIRVEDGSEFRSADPDDNHRPDITILVSLGNPNAKRYLLDFAITSHIIGAVKGVLKTGASRETVKKNPNRILIIRRNAKLNKYKEREALNGCGVQPFVFMSTATLDPEAEKFTKILCMMAKDTLCLPPGIIYNHLIRQLLVALVRGVARVIDSRTYRLINTSSKSCSRFPPKLSVYVFHNFVKQ